MGYVEELRKKVGRSPVILTGAVAIITDGGNRILLQKRKVSVGQWGLPGGLMEPGESLEETARREVFEESGLCIGGLELAGLFSGADYFIRLPNGDEFYSVTVAFLVNKVSGELTVDPEESLGFEYWDIRNLPENMNLHHLRMIEKFMELRTKEIKQCE